MVCDFKNDLYNEISNCGFICFPDLSPDRFKKSVMMMLSDLNTKMDVILKILKSNLSNYESVEIEGFPNFPLKTIEELEAVEKLVKNEEVFKQMVIEM